MRWVEALKLWNAKKGGMWCVPKKGTPEHAEVKKIMGPTKAELKRALKERESAKIEAPKPKEAAKKPMESKPAAPKPRKIKILDVPEITFDEEPEKPAEKPAEKPKAVEKATSTTEAQEIALKAIKKNLELGGFLTKGLFDAALKIRKGKLKGKELEDAVNSLKNRFAAYESGELTKDRSAESLSGIAKEIEEFKQLRRSKAYQDAHWKQRPLGKEMAETTSQDEYLDLKRASEKKVKEFYTREGITSEDKLFARDDLIKKLLTIHKNPAVGSDIKVSVDKSGKSSSIFYDLDTFLTGLIKVHPSPQEKIQARYEINHLHVPHPQNKSSF